MKNIHLFKTEAAYDAAKDSLILPRLSYIEETKVVDYNPHHDYVEIAGIKWATMNIGAKSITDTGLYFQWGDTQGYTAKQITGDTEVTFSWKDYKFTTDGGKNFNKYNGTDNNTVLTSDDDAVHAAWGGSWRMPTKEEYQALRHAVNTGWTFSYNESGVKGLLCTDKTDTSKTLFLPACGYANYNSISYANIFGCYWLSKLNTDNVSRAYMWSCDRGGMTFDTNSRDNGYCVRGVLAEN